MIHHLFIGKGPLFKAVTTVDATPIAAPRSTKNKNSLCDPEMHQCRKDNTWFVGMTAHIGLHANSGLVHTVPGTAGNLSDIVEANSLLDRQERVVFADSGYQGAAGRPDIRADANRRIELRLSHHRALDKIKEIDALVDRVKKLKASVRAKVEHAFQIVKHQLGYMRVRDRGLKRTQHSSLRCLRCPTYG